jgi:hypothetical protein
MSRLWKPSSQRKPRGKKLREGTAVYSAASQYFTGDEERSDLEMEKKGKISL